MPRYAPPPTPPATYTEAILDSFDHYVTTEVYVLVLLVAAAVAIGRYGLYAVLLSPWTFVSWAYHALRSFRFRPVIIAFGTTEDELADRTADKVLSKADAQAAKQRDLKQQQQLSSDDVDAVADQQQPGAPNSAQRSAGLRRRPQVQDGGAV